MVVSVVDRGDVALDVVASALYVANWRFGLDAVDYFAAGVPSPVLHFWSLAVEEQFYLVWPWLLLLVTRWARRSGRSLTPPLLLGLVVVAVPSLWWSSVQTESSPGWAYFSTFTRAWELAVGGALVMVLPAAGPHAARRRRAAGLGRGLGRGVVGACTSPSRWPSPAPPRSCPCWARAALVAAGAGCRTPARRVLLSHPVLVRIGGVSYSWYLWHWPLLVFAAILVGGELPLWLALPVVALSYGVAVLSRRYVEEPFHHSAVLSRHPERALRLGAVCTAAGVLAGLVLVVPAALADRSAARPAVGARAPAAPRRRPRPTPTAGGAPGGTAVPAVPGPASSRP